MFVADEIAVPVRLEDAVARLTHVINWGGLHRTSDAAFEGGLSAVLRAGPFGPVPGLSRLVRVQLAEPVRRGAVVTVPMRWEATGAAGEPFPVLDADLLLAGDGPDRSRLGLAGSYRPPFGRAGRVPDEAVMHHLATATVASLLAGVAARITGAHPGSVLSHSY